MNDLSQAIKLCYIFSDGNDFNLNKYPNRIEIIRDFDHLIENNQDKLNKNYNENNQITLSDDKLFSKLQKIIFKRISNINDHENLKNILIDDVISSNNILTNNIYDIANSWCKHKYGLN